MLRMTRHLNSGLVQPRRRGRSHLLHLPPWPARAGGDLVPQRPGAAPPVHRQAGQLDRGRGHRAQVLPDASYAEYFLGDEPIVVQSTTVQPSHTISAQSEAKRIYEMMMTLSDGIGVNCGFCHNTRSFQSWQESTPYRWVTYDAINMLRDLNRNFLLPLADVIPQTRTLEDETRLPVLPARQTGQQLGNGLALCGTCHQGVTKPLNGANMVHDYPGLFPAAAPAAPAAPEAPAAPATDQRASQ